MTRWVLIADASRARLFRDERDEHRDDDGDRRRAFTLLDSLEHPSSRARVRDLMADVNGRKPSGMTRGGAAAAAATASSSARPGAAPFTDPKAVEAEKFARELAERLAKGLHEHAFDRLIVAAPPHFLGVLRQLLDGEVAKHVDRFINKDLTQHDQDDIERHVRTELGG